MFSVLPFSFFLTFLFLWFSLSCHPYSEEDGEQEDKTIWYYSTKVSAYFPLSEIVCATVCYLFKFLTKIYLNILLFVFLLLACVFYIVFIEPF